MSEPFTDEEADGVCILVDCFQGLAADRSSDEYVCALAMALAAEISRRFDPSMWQDRVDRLAYMIMADMLADHQTDLPM